MQQAIAFSAVFSPTTPSIAGIIVLLPVRSNSGLGGMGGDLPASLRCATIQTNHLLFLTATPHKGDEETWREQTGDR